MKTVKGEEIVGRTPKIERIAIRLPAPPNGNKNAPVPYGILNAALQTNFTTFGQVLYGIRVTNIGLLQQLTDLTKKVGELSDRIVKLEKKKQ